MSEREDAPRVVILEGAALAKLLASPVTRALLEDDPDLRRWCAERFAPPRPEPRAEDLVVLPVAPPQNRHERRAIAAQKRRGNPR